MSTFINFLWFILFFIQSYLSLAEAFNWFPSVAKNDNNNDESINGKDIASSFTAHRDVALEDPQLLSKGNKTLECLKKFARSQKIFSLPPIIDLATDTISFVE